MKNRKSKRSRKVRKSKRSRKVRKSKRSRKDGFRSRRPILYPENMNINKYYYIIDHDNNIVAHGNFIGFPRGRRDSLTLKFNNLTYVDNGKFLQQKEIPLHEDEFSCDQYNFEDDIPDALPHF